MSKGKEIVENIVMDLEWIRRTPQNMERQRQWSWATYPRLHEGPPAWLALKSKDQWIPQLWCVYGYVTPSIAHSAE